MTHSASRPPARHGLAPLVLGAAGLCLPLPVQAHGFETSCTPAAQAAFAEGLHLIHNMMYIQSEAAFGTAAEADPACAMAQWGLAMANFHPLWPGSPTEAETRRGTAAAEKLGSLQAGTDVEQALIEAALAFYAPDLDAYRPRIEAWAAAQIAAGEAHADNVDAAALAALARLSVAPPGPAGIETATSVGATLDALHEAHPDHPGVIHYAIHAYDNPALKDRGTRYAAIYDKTAPDAAHALHMPSHIFTRTGDWGPSIDLNRRSAEAALAQSGDVIQTHYVHAIDYMVYGYLQLGQVDTARALVDQMLAIDNHQVSFGGAYALAASPVRLLLETGDWAGAAALPDQMHPAIPWQAFPQAVAMRQFAKGLGAARSGDVATARDAVAELGRIRAELETRNLGYWARLAESQILSVEAWIELAEGNPELALTHQASAADIEDAAGKSPVTPGHVLPARELLADMQSQLGHAAEAQAAYRETLRLSPNRGRSLAALK